MAEISVKKMKMKKKSPSNLLSVSVLNRVSKNQATAVRSNGVLFRVFEISSKLHEFVWRITFAAVSLV